jgi:hypothetical protein
MPKTDAEKREISSDHRIQMTQERTFCSGILSVTTTFRLLVTGSTDLTELERIIRILQVQKDILAEADAGAKAEEVTPSTVEIIDAASNEK